MKVNQPLFNWLSEKLRFINPRMYARFLSTQEKLIEARLVDPDLPFPGVWLGLAFNQSMTEPGLPHIDTSDIPFGFNCVVPWGSFKTARLLLWQGKIAIEQRPGDVMFFFGRLFTHNTAYIQGGERHMMDLFTHAIVVKFAEEFHGSYWQKLRVDQHRRLAKKTKGLVTKKALRLAVNTEHLRRRAAASGELPPAEIRPAEKQVQAKPPTKSTKRKPEAEEAPAELRRSKRVKEAVEKRRAAAVVEEVEGDEPMTATEDEGDDENDLGEDDGSDVDNQDDFKRPRSLMKQ